MKPLNFLALILFVAGLVWVFTLSEKSVRHIQQSYYSAISPLISKGSETEAFANKFLEEVEHSADLEKRMEQVIEQRDRFRLIAGRVRELEAENNQLRNALDFKKKTQFDVVAARVIRKQPQMWGKTIEIDRGTDDGFEADPQFDLCVLASNGGLVGRLQLSGEQISSVLLITDEISQVSAEVEGTSEVGIIVGRQTTFGQTPRLRLRYLSKTAILKKGMKVYTDGRGKLFPPNIPIGTIEDFEVGPVYGEAEIKPAVDFTNLKNVFVITDSPGG
ncbi:MAG TPA: rod shape-determining protein MreC [Verrucomicrobiales bacterium]|nr:rod shape-determining protein MreC [Verrucomicrobiales bacterium]